MIRRCIVIAGLLLAVPAMAETYTPNEIETASKAMINVLGMMEAVTVSCPTTDRDALAHISRLMMYGAAMQNKSTPDQVEAAAKPRMQKRIRGHDIERAG